MKRILWTLLCVGWISGSAQSVEENLQKYWRYRERLVKDFVKVGAFNGNSLVMSARSIGFAYDGAPLNDEGLPPSRIYYQDATIYHGHYLLMLATEYKLLQQVLNTTMDGAEYTAAERKLESTKSEIYFALNALNRLGIYFNTVTLASAELVNNGIHSRDDVGYGYHENYDGDYSEVFGRNTDFILTHSDAFPIQMWGPNAGQPNPNNGGNVMSLDQITTMFTGLMAVYKLVGDEVYQPSSDYPEMNFKLEARTLAWKIIDYVIEPVSGCGNNCYKFNIYHPDDIFRPAGYELTFAAPFIVNIAYEFGHPLWVGKVQANTVHNMKLALQLHPSKIIDIIDDMDFPGLALGMNCHDNIYDLCVDRLANKEPVTVATIEYAALYYFYEEIQNQWVDLSVGGEPCFDFNSSFFNLVESLNFDVEGVFCDNINWRSLVLDHLVLDNISAWGPLTILHLNGDNSYGTLCISDLPNSEQITARINDDNVHMFCELASLANVWEPEYFQWIANESGMHWIGLLRSVLHADSYPLPGLSKLSIENLYLNTAPCEGPWDDPHTSTLPTPNTTQGWRAANRLFHPSDAELGIPDRSFRGEFSGIDYLVYHNLYHCIWGEELPSYYSDNGCKCLEEFTETASLNLPISVEPKFQNYDEFSISAPAYLSHDLNLFGAGVIDVKNDMVICSPQGTTTELLLQSGSKLKLYAGYEMIINSNSSVIMEDGSEFIAGLYPLEDALEDNETWIRIKNGAKLEIQDGAKFIPYIRLKVIIEDGGSLVVNGGEIEFNQSCSGCGISMQGSQSRFEIYNGIVQNLGTGDVHVIASNGAHIVSSSSQIDITPGYFNFNESVSLDIDNSTLKFSEGECRSQKTNWNIHHSTLDFNEQEVVIFNESVLNLTGSTIKLNQSFFKLRPEYNVNTNSNSEALHVNTNNARVELNGANSKFEIFNTQVNINANSDLLFCAAQGSQHGQVVVRGAGTHDFMLEDNSTLRFKGNSVNNPMIQVNSGSDLWIPAWRGSVIITDCAVDLTDNGRLWCGARLDMNKTRSYDNSANQYGGDIECWYNPTNVAYSVFDGVGIKGVGSNVGINSSEFLDHRSSLALDGGSYKVTRSKFIRCGIDSRKLDNISSVTQSVFDHEEMDYTGFAVSDVSIVEVLVSNCSFEKYSYGIAKAGGTLSARCTEFKDNLVGIGVETAVLNLSSERSGGYNNFVDNAVNIEAQNMLTYNLEKGFNSFEPYLSCNIYTTSIIPFEGDVLDVSATGNIWNLPDGYYTGEGYVEGSGITCYTGSAEYEGYIIRFHDSSPAVDNRCPSEKPVVRPPARKNAKQAMDGISVATVDLEGLQKSGNDCETVDTYSYQGVCLDSALTHAAGYLEFYDSTGNDLEALGLFYEILLSDLNRDDSYTRELAFWGVNMMKNAVEGLFISGELDQNSNQETFELPVQRYVDVLNAYTDTMLTSGTYRQQFELELLKGQLFLTIGKPEIALEVFVNLNTCSLDSLEQENLNNWKQEAMRFILISNQYASGVPPDSISYEISMSEDFEITETESSDFYFGATIHDPNYVSYVTCGGQANYKILQLAGDSDRVFPNPASDHITLSCDLGEDIATELSILDTQGRVVFQDLVSLTGKVNYMFILGNELNAGAYLLQVKCNDSLRNYMFIKE